MICPLIRANMIPSPRPSSTTSTAYGPATELETQVASIDVSGTAAIVRLELTNLNGARYTDMFTLLKVEGEWKIMNKVFHLHS